MSSQVETAARNLPFPTDDKKQHELRSIVANYLLITYHCDAVPISIEKVQFDFFRYYTITRPELVKFLESDILARFDVRFLENDQVTVFLRLPLSANDNLIVIEVEKWRADLAHNLNIQLSTFELSKVNGIVPRPALLAGTMKTLKMKDILEHDPKHRFEVFGAIPFLYVNRINLNAEEIEMAVAAWKRHILDFLGCQGWYKKLSEVATFCPRPRQLPPHHKILAMLRSDSLNRFHFMQEGGELQVKAVIDGNTPQSLVLCNEWRENIAQYLSSQGGKTKSPCDIGVVVHRPTQLPPTYKMLEVLKADPLRRFDCKGDSRDLKVGLKAKARKLSRALSIDYKKDESVNETLWKHHDTDNDGTSVVSGISEELSSVNGKEDYLDLQKQIEFKFKSSDSASVRPVEQIGNEAAFDQGGSDTPMTGAKVLTDFGMHIAPWNAAPAYPPGLSVPIDHWGMNGDFFKPFTSADPDIDAARLPAVRFTDFTSGDTSHDMWAKTGSISSFYGQQVPPRSYSPVRSQSPLRLNVFGTLKPSMSRSPHRIRNFGSDTLKPTASPQQTRVTKYGVDHSKPPVLLVQRTATTPASANVELKLWLPKVLQGFDSNLIVTFVDQMRDDYGFLTTEDLCNAQIGEQLTLDVLRDISGFKIGHFNRIVKGLASLRK